eukprot:SAG31_NODE_17091_length_684_cov_0.683761_1_plen_166_part_00
MPVLPPASLHCLEIDLVLAVAQFFNFHNELAYMEADKHAELGYANYALFCCTDPPDVGGYTILSDARRVHTRLSELLPELPQSFKFVIARKALSVPELRPTGDYEGFLQGDWEFEGYPDQWAPVPAQREADVRRRCAELGIEVEIDPDRGDMVSCRRIQHNYLLA